MKNLEENRKKFLAISKPVKQYNDEVPEFNQIGHLDYKKIIDSGAEELKNTNLREVRKARKINRLFANL